MPQSPDIGQNSDGGISGISGPVTKLNKRNKTMSKKIDDDVISAIWDVIVIFPVYGQFGANWKSASGRIVCKTPIFINNSLLSCKNWKQNWKILNTAVTILFWVKVQFLHKKADFLQNKYTDISKIKTALELKGVFSETTHIFVLTYQF